MKPICKDHIQLSEGIDGVINMKYKKAPDANLICLFCKKDFIGNPRIRKYCSLECQFNFLNPKQEKFPVAPSTVGAIGELVIATDLMKKGYEVYRSLSPASSCDLLALKNEKLYKFEVRTARYSKNKKVDYAKNNIRADNIALVIIPEMEIRYMPELEI